MSSRNPSRILAALALAALLTSAPAAAKGSPFGPLAGQGVWAWLADLLESVWSDEGVSIDPDGRPVVPAVHRDPVAISAPEGVSIDPNGAPHRVEGGSIDPDGL